MIRHLSLALFALLTFCGCGPSEAEIEERIEAELKANCRCWKVERIPTASENLIAFNLHSSKKMGRLHETDQLMKTLMKNIRGFCSLEKTIILHFIGDDGKQGWSIHYPIKQVCARPK